jgi:hypothetical protein
MFVLLGPRSVNDRFFSPLRNGMLMVNPYNPPIPASSEPRSAEIVPTWALRSFGVFPVAIIASYLIEAIAFPTRGWNPADWFWAVGPPAYLVFVWALALFSNHRGSRKQRVWLAISILPLLLIASHVWSDAINWFIFVSKAGLDGFGINDDYRLFAICMPLWLGASTTYTLYFLCLLRRLKRFKSEN